MGVGTLLFFVRLLDLSATRPHDGGLPLGWTLLPVISPRKKLRGNFFYLRDKNFYLRRRKNYL